MRGKGVGFSCGGDRAKNAAEMALEKGILRDIKVSLLANRIFEKKVRLVHETGL